MAGGTPPRSPVALSAGPPEFDPRLIEPSGRSVSITGVAHLTGLYMTGTASFRAYTAGMWNITAELAQIRRQELLAEAREERLARIARHDERPHPARRDLVTATADERRPVTEAPLR
jgi:hypothetical protein